MTASDLKPKLCPRCGERVTAKVWPFALVMALFVPVAYGALFAVFSFRQMWPLYAAVFLFMLGVLVAAHFSPLTPSTPQRVRIAKLLYALVWVGVVGWFAWQLFGQLHVA